MSLVSPLNRVLGLGAARGGAEHWRVQRVTAVALVPLGLWLCFGVLSLEDLSYAAAMEWVRHPVAGIMFVLTALAVGYHSHLGVQVVIEDYVRAPGLKAAVLILSALAHAAVTIASVFAVLKVALGS